MSRFIRLLSCLVPTVALVAADPFVRPGAVQLGNLNAQPVGSESALMAGTGVARGDGVDAPWANPAGLGVVGRPRLEMSGTVYQLSRTRMADETSGNDDYAVRIVPTFTGYTSGGLGADKRWTAAVYSVVRADWSHDTALSETRFLSGQNRRFQIDASSSYLAWEGGVGVGTTVPGTSLRLGTALNATYNSYTQHTASTVAEGGSSPTTITTQGAESLTAVHLRPVFAAQYDLADGLTVGATARLAGMQVWEHGRVDSAYQQLTTSDTSWLIQYDDDVALDWPVPAEVVCGACWDTLYGGIAAEIRWTGSRDGRTVVHSNVPGTGQIITFSGTTTAWSAAMPNETAAGSNTLGWAVGGWYRLTPGTRIMSGLWYDPSSASASDTLFTPVDLYGATLGTGFTWERSELLVGASAAWGSCQDYLLLPDTPVQVNVINVSLVVGSHITF